MTITINDRYEVDFENNTILCLKNGRQNVLGGNESMLLQHFLQHPGIPQSHQALLDAVWTSRGLIVDEGSLTQGIFQLRKAFGDSDNTLFKTIRGRGYVFTGQTSNHQAKQKITAFKSWPLVLYPVFTMVIAALTWALLQFFSPAVLPADSHLIARHSRCTVTMPGQSEPAVLSGVDRYQAKNTILLIADDGKSVSFPLDYEEAHCEN